MVRCFVLFLLRILESLIEASFLVNFLALVYLLARRKLLRNIQALFKLCGLIGINALHLQGLEPPQNLTSLLAFLHLALCDAASLVKLEMEFALLRTFDFVIWILIVVRIDFLHFCYKFLDFRVLQAGKVGSDQIECFLLAQGAGLDLDHLLVCPACIHWALRATGSRLLNTSIFVVFKIWQLAVRKFIFVFEFFHYCWLGVLQALLIGQHLLRPLALETKAVVTCWFDHSRVLVQQLVRDHLVWVYTGQTSWGVGGARMKLELLFGDVLHGMAKLQVVSRASLELNFWHICVEIFEII